MKATNAWRGYLLALLAATLWATLGLFGKSLYRYDVDPVLLITLRASIASLTLGVILLIFRPGLLRIRWDDLPFLLFYGLVGVALNYACYFMALKWTTVTTAVFLLYLYPGLVVLGATVFLGERITPLKLMALVAALAGSALVAQAFNLADLALNLTGVLYSLGAALTMAVYTLLGKYGLKRYSGWTLIFYGVGFAALAFFLWQGRRLEIALRYPWQAWLLILGVAWIPTLIAYSSFTLSLGFIEASHAAIITYLEPVLAAGLAYFLLAERLDILQGVGAVLILTGIMALQLKEGLPPTKEVKIGESVNS
ncbi:MAG TPA: EamA family transporter [Anaerolineales bacterium]|nr:EamA family transporter [Anaerolineales bacterium]